MNPTTKSLLSFGKMLLWTAAGAAVTAAINELPNVQLPYEWLSPIIGAVLKGLATLIATKKAGL